MEGGDLGMSNIEERVVRMKFDNAQFGAGVASTLKQLQTLNAALKFEGAAQGLTQLSNTVGNFSTAGAQEQVSGLTSRFGALQIAALTALTNIVNRAVDTGLQVAKSLTIEPVMAGFREYETNLGSIQTILANTGLKGAEGLEKVNEALDELNHYSDQTIYNFSQMAKNIGTFTAAGIDLDTSTAAIKGIANLAAVSGSNAEQASAAMYQLSQALSAGKVTLEDWNSVVNAGMGGKVFQESLKETARAHGVAVDDIIKKQGSFRMSLQEGWITTEILTETLSKFTGDLTADQLKSMGYTEQQIAGILEMGKTAVDAATKVKSMSQLLDTLREAVSSGWAQTWEIVFGEFDEAKELFTNVNNVLGGMISASADARNELLQGWKDLGGRKALIDGIANAFNALIAILKPIKDAFREIFPATTAKQLYDVTVSFRDFMAQLKIGEGTANNLRRTFAGFFAILGIGWELLKAGVKFIFDLIGSLTEGTGGFLEFTGGIGDWLVALHKAIKEGQAFTKFFDVLGKILSYPIKLIQLIASLLGTLFSSLNADNATDSINKMTDALGPLERLGRFIGNLWKNIQEIFTDFVDSLDPAAQKFVEWAKNVGSSIGEAFQGFSFENLLSGIQTGLFAGLFLILRKFLGGITDAVGDFFGGGAGIFDGVIDALDGLTGALQGMQNALNATALLMIATAVGILTLSLIGLSDIDAAGLTRASVAIAVMFGQLSLAFIAFNKISTGGAALKVGVMSAGLILLATAIRILASSVAKLAGIPIEELRRGLIAVAILLASVVASTNRLKSNNAGIIRTAAGLTILSVAIRLLVESVEELSKMDWNSLAKGLVGVGALLASLTLFTKFAAADKGGVTQGAGIVLLALGIKILANALQDFTQFNWEQIARGMSGIAVGLGLLTAALNLLPQGSVLKAAGLVIVAASLKLIADGVVDMSGLKWDQIARGLTVMAGALISIAVALRLFPASSVLKAASLLIVASSLSLIQKALGNMSGMTWEEIAKGLTVLAGSLILIAAAVRVTEGALSGAAAIFVIAAALNMMVPVLTALGEMSWEEIIKGLTALAGVFVIIGLAGLLLAPLAPVIFSLAAGIALLGLAVLAAGVGVLAFATGLTILAAAGTGAVAAIVGIVAGLVGLIPYVMQQIALGLVAFAQVIATSGPAILGAMTTVLNSLLDAIIQAIPKLVNAVITMITELLEEFANAVPKMTASGAKIVKGFLKGVADGLPGVIDQGARIVVAFLEGIGRNSGMIIDAAVDMIFDFIHAIADAIRNSGERIVNAGIDIATAIIEGIIRGLAQLVWKVLEAIGDLVSSMWNAVTDFFGIASPSKLFMWGAKQMALGLAVGLDKNSDIASKAAVGMGENVIDSLGKTLDGLSSVLGKDLIDFDPVISPVLDLTQIKKDAGQINQLLDMPELDVSASYKAAKNAGSGYESNRANSDDIDNPSGGDVYNYTQNNTSPKALSSAEIYRQTRNLISRKKGTSSANQI
jgi:tape measure domain-containing protein